jgi:altronate hydrolase
MFGAESALFAHCADRDLFERAVRLVQGFRSYFVEHGQPVHENPAPGNKDGGITTLEEKSLGCVQKGGDAPITDVVAYGARARLPGLTLLQAPGNDQVSTTALVAAGATVVLFTTGRGTPLGSPAPTLKVSTNQELSRRKPGWIDFDAGVLATGADPAEIDGRFLDLVLEVASGRRTRNELHDQRDIGIFKGGVTL